LKDGKVLGEDGKLHLAPNLPADKTEDELQNVNMVDDEVLRAAKERKRKAQAQYTGLDDDEFDEDRIGVKADVLGKYDDSFASGKVKTEVCCPTPHQAMTNI
jgi:U4/U6.U5 tri-snRNP-associated protein 1